MVGGWRGVHAWLQGLGTSTKDEAREYFSNLMRHRKEFIWEGASGLRMQPAAPPSWLLRSMSGLLTCRGRSFILAKAQVHTMLGGVISRPAPSDLHACVRATRWSLHAGDDDGAAIELAFSKKKIEERKEWLAACEAGTYLDMTPEQISYSDFINKVRARQRLLCGHAFA